MRSSVAFVVILSITGGCSANRTAGSRDVTSRSSSVLERSEILAYSGQTALQAIESLRPWFLRPRWRLDEPIRIYIDDFRLENFAQLGDVQAMFVSEIRLLSPTDATLRYGTGHTGGALIVRTAGRAAPRLE